MYGFYGLNTLLYHISESCPHIWSAQLVSPELFHPLVTKFDQVFYLLLRYFHQFCNLNVEWIEGDSNSEKSFLVKSQVCGIGNLAYYSSGT